MLDGTERSLNQTLEELLRFSKISGLNINFNKTQLVWIWLRKISTRSIKTKWKLLWGSNQFKLLGILFNTDLDQMIKNNYIPKVTQMKKILKQWNKRSLSYTYTSIALDTRLLAQAYRPGQIELSSPGIQKSSRGLIRGLIPGLIFFCPALPSS